MTDTPEDEPKPETTKGKVVAGAKKTAELADKVGTTAEVANNAFGAIKWVAIAVVTLAFLGGGYGIYKAVTKPVEVISDAAGAVADKVGGGAGAIKDGASNVLNRLVIPATNPQNLGTLADAAFPALFKMEKTESNGVREGMFRRTNFGGSEGKVCKFDLDYGGGALTTFAAADVSAHETAASLGSKDERLIRMVIRTEDDDIAFNTAWDSEEEVWVMKWKRTTVSKPVNDKIAEARLLDILAAVPPNCR